MGEPTFGCVLLHLGATVDCVYSSLERWRVARSYCRAQITSFEKCEPCVWEVILIFGSAAMMVQSWSRRS